MAGITLSKRMQDWRLLLDQSAVLIETTPHLTARRDELAGVVAEIDAFDARAEQRRAEGMEATQKRREAEVRGVESRARFAAGLIELLGPKNELLNGFGVTRQKREVRRRSKAAVALAKLQEEQAKAEAEKAGKPAPPAPAEVR